MGSTSNCRLMAALGLAAMAVAAAGPRPIGVAAWPLADEGSSTAIGQAGGAADLVADSNGDRVADATRRVQTDIAPIASAPQPAGVGGPTAAGASARSRLDAPRRPSGVLRRGVGAMVDALDEGPWSIGPSAVQHHAGELRALLGRLALTPVGRDLASGPSSDDRRFGVAAMDDVDLVVGWPGFDATQWHPASPQVAAGPSDVIGTVNSAFRVFDRQGGTVAATWSMDNWFASVLNSQTSYRIFSPTTLYDPIARRFVMAAVADAASAAESWFLLAISQTDSATGDWCLFRQSARFEGSTLSDTAARSLQMGVNEDTVILAADMADMASGDFRYAKVRFLPKSHYYDTACLSPAQFTDVWNLLDTAGDPVDGVLPVRMASAGHDAVLVATAALGGDVLHVWNVATETGSLPLGQPLRRLQRADVDVDRYAAPPNAEQPGTAAVIQTGSARVLNAIEDGGALWVAHNTACVWDGDPGVRACARWYHLDAAAQQLVAQGTFGHRGEFAFYPVIAPAGNGRAAVAYNVSSDRQAVGALVACVPAPQSAMWLREGDGCFQDDATSAVGLWGHFNGAAVDPAGGGAYFHAASVAGADADCAANAWTTSLAQVRCMAGGVPSPGAPTPEPSGVPTLARPTPRTVTPVPTLAPDCSSAIDVVLVLDSSGSIDDGEYEVMRQFALDMVDALSVSAQGAHVGVVQFGNPADNIVEVQLSGDRTAVRSALANMNQLKGSTDMAGGLGLARGELAARGRNGVGQTAVILSDGKAERPDDATRAAQALKDAGVSVFAIGVGDELDVGHLQSLVSTPVVRHFFYASEFTELARIMVQLVVSVCPTPTATVPPTRTATRTPTVPPTPTPTRTPTARAAPGRIYLPIASFVDCACPPLHLFTDTVIVLDASTSMQRVSTSGRMKYQEAVDAARLFAQGLRLRPGGDQVALVAFNDLEHTLQPLTDDYAALDAALTQFTPIRDGSRLERGLNGANRQFSLARHRPGNRRAIVILSDGIANPERAAEEAVDVADRLKENGILIYVVGVGEDMRRDVLSRIASDVTRFYPAPQVEALARIYGELVVEVLCAGENYWPSSRFMCVP